MFSRLPRTFHALQGVNHPIVILCSAVALATAVRSVVDPLVHNHGPYLFFAIAVVIAALYGGLWAGIGATLISIPVCDYLFIAPRHTWFVYDSRGDSIMIALFAVLGLLTTGIIYCFHQTSKRLEQSLLDLERSESKLEMITSTIPEILFTITSNGVAEYWNGHFSKYSGRSSSELVGRGWLELIHPDDRAGMDRELSESFETSGELETFIRFRGANGVYRWFKWHATPVLNAAGNVEKWFGVCSDIDDEIRLTAALQSRTQELMLLNEGLERFAHTASHDLRSPLNTMRMLIDVFLRSNGGGLDSKTSELFSRVIKSTEQMMRLVDDIMKFATAANTAKQASVPVDTHAAAEVAISNLGQAIEQSGARIVLERLPAVAANESAILRLFQNLIANAIKYRGENAPYVHICVSERNEEWVFSVKDNGIGIDPRYHDMIFAPFCRLHRQSEYEGSGIGLATCHRIVQSFNGRIWVESKPGEGSAFFFTIPKHIDCGNRATDPSVMLIRESSTSTAAGRL